MEATATVRRRLPRLTAPRAERLIAGVTLESLSREAGISMRRLSEYERAVGRVGLTAAENHRRRAAIEKISKDGAA